MTEVVMPSSAKSLCTLQSSEIDTGQEMLLQKHQNDFSAVDLVRCSYEVAPSILLLPVIDVAAHIVSLFKCLDVSHLSSRTQHLCVQAHCVNVWHKLPGSWTFATLAVDQIAVNTLWMKSLCASLLL